MKARINKAHLLLNIVTAVLILSDIAVGIYDIKVGNATGCALVAIAATSLLITRVCMHALEKGRKDV